MPQEPPEKDGHELPDDYWIFEELGSPLKQPSSQHHEHTSSDSPSTPKALCKNVFEEKLRIYADNMRKLIVTARKTIKELKQENVTLKQKLEASGLIECPACLFHFKPEKKNRILPKYVRIFRGKLALEVEFASLDEMSEWLTVNQLDENSDGLPTMLQKEEKLDLTTTGSLLHKLVSEQKETKTKRERVVISTRPHSSHSRPSQSCSADAPPFPKSTVRESDDIANSHRHNRESKNRRTERRSSSGITHESPSVTSETKISEGSEKKVNLGDPLPPEPFARIPSSLKERLSMETLNSSDGRQNSRRIREETKERSRTDDSEKKSHAVEPTRSRAHKEPDGDWKRDSSRRHDYRNDRRDASKRPEHNEVISPSARHHASHQSEKETGAKRSLKSDENSEKRSRLDDHYRKRHISSHSDQTRSPFKTKEDDESSVNRKNAQNTDARHGVDPSGKENVQQKGSDRGKRRRVDSPHHRRADEVPKNEKHVEDKPLENSSKTSVHRRDFKADRHGGDSKADRHGDSQRHESRREHDSAKHDSTKDSIRRNIDGKDLRTVRSTVSIPDGSDKVHRNHSTRESRDQQRSNRDSRDSSSKRSPLKTSHRTEHGHSSKDASKDRLERSKRTKASDDDRAFSSRKERSSQWHGCAREGDEKRQEKRKESTEDSHHPRHSSRSPKKRKLSTSSQMAADGEEQELVVSDIDLVMVDEDEVEDGELLD